MKLKRKPSTYVTISNREVFSSAVGYFYGQQKDSTLLSNDTVKYWYYTQSMVEECKSMVESSWNVMAHGDAREGKWRGNWRMEWVASTLHTISEHGVSRITTADAHTSAASSRLNWRTCRFKWTRPVPLKDEIWFMRVCHHISDAVYEEFMWWRWQGKTEYSGKDLSSATLFTKIPTRTGLGSASEHRG